MTPLDTLIAAVRRVEAGSPGQPVPLNADQIIVLLGTLATDPRARSAWRVLREHVRTIINAKLRQVGP